MEGVERPCRGLCSRSGNLKGNFPPGCCVFATPARTGQAYNPLGGIGMFDVYVRGKNQLLVIRRGTPLPTQALGGWKRKRATSKVSDEISRTIGREGFYIRTEISQLDAGDADRKGLGHDLCLGFTAKV